MMKKGLSATLALCSMLLMLLSLTLGPSKISLANTIAILTGQEVGGNQGYIIWQLRLPRILASFFSGAILGCAGTVFQAALRNPMADPFILGISSGASFGVALALFIGIAPLLGFPLSALIGANLTTLFIVGMSLKRKSSDTTLLLTGVAVNYILSAAMTLLMFLHREQYQRILYWTLGSFSTSTYAQVIILSITFLLLFILLRANHQTMDMLLLDEASAHAGGLAVGKTRLLLLLAGSAASAICVSYFGVIGFIGLMAPHVTRLLVGPKHSRLLLPASLFGGFLLLASDTVARVMLPTGELPVGIITSLLGVPLFIYLLRKGRYRYG
ncbi:MAG: cobalamin transport system permease protein [Sphaerochaeta sp.]|jgi:iron complex transport system permease protein|nr:cobalamin transport system permease protein [Sphaerochaeta sp.]MDN5333152.1 cobalamin transport system permease protein [Sphaerochaeta sp.]